MKKVTTLVLPVAGLGKRLLPLTKRTPKNLLRVNGKPLLEYVLEEAVDAGIKDVVLVINPKHKEHFRKYITANQKRFPAISFHVRVQETPGGNGHALISAYDLVKNKPFAVRFCDDILAGESSALQSLIEIFNHYKAPVILLEQVPKKSVTRYGVVGFKRRIKNTVSSAGGEIYELTKVVEKPKLHEAPSNLIILGGYVLTPESLKTLKMISDSLPYVADDAIPIVVALQVEFIRGGKVYGWRFPGRRLDCGTLENLKKSEEFLKAAFAGA